MSIYVTVFGDKWTVFHDEMNHGGDIDPTEVQYVLNMDGSHNHEYAAVKCPACDLVTIHPVGGGAQPPLVQEMFVRLAQSDGCQCAADLPGGLPIQLTAGHVKQHCEQMDGEGRWQVGVLQ